VVIAWLVIATGRTEDLTGAMEYLGKGVGRGLLIVMVVGMTGYGLWRLGDAMFGMDSGRHHPKAWKRRTAAAASGVIYLGLAYKAAQTLISGHTEGDGVHRSAATALHLPGGDLALGLAAAVLCGAGLVQLYKAFSCSFLAHLDDRARRPFAKWLGRCGYAARGVIFLTIAWLLTRSALNRSAAEAGGLEQALDALRGPLQTPIAAGLLLFGLYSIFEARFRSIHRPPVERLKQRVESKLAS
jgi:hypothetical protein